MNYADKKKSGNMMYGPGCCGHSLPANPSRIHQDIIDKLRRRQAALQKQRKPL